jgi:hypothetical protein
MQPLSSTSMACVVYLVEDLFFAAKLRDAAEQLGLEVQRAPDADTLPIVARDAALVVLDLRRQDALRALELLAAHPATSAVRSVGFVDHERVEIMDAARERGCTTVLSKRRFATELPKLLQATRDHVSGRDGERK